MSDDPSPRPSHPAYQAQPGYLPAPGRPAENHRVLRLLALTAVGLGVLVLAAAAFLLSYPGIHAVALQAGVSASRARIYPVIFDAMLVIASAAVLALRGAGLVSRVYAWLSLLALLAAAAGADALHSTGIKPPHRVAAAVAAILPWALVLIGFALLLAMLRHARLHRAAAAAAASRQPAAGGQPAAYRPAPPPVAALPPGSTPRAGNSRPGPALPAGTAQPGLPEVAVAAPGLLQVPRQAFPEPAAEVAGPAGHRQDQAAGPAAPEPTAPAEAQPDHAVPAQAVPGHTVPGHTVPAQAVPAQAVPAQAVPAQAAPAQAAPAQAVPAQAAPAQAAPAQAAPAQAVPAQAAPEDAVPQDAVPEHAVPEPAIPGLAAPVPADAELDEPRLGTSPARAGVRPGADAPPPAFHRMWSSPTPPGEDDED